MTIIVDINPGQTRVYIHDDATRPGRGPSGDCGGEPVRLGIPPVMRRRALAPLVSAQAVFAASRGHRGSLEPGLSSGGGVGADDLVGVDVEQPEGARPALILQGAADGWGRAWGARTSPSSVGVTSSPKTGPALTDPSARVRAMY